MNYDVVVVGGGHAGVEAALACSKNNLNTILITSNIKNISNMPCNPSLGGSAKGILVREIDALGGSMGKIGDKCVLQMKMLNSKKGPGVRSLRAQIDKEKYKDEMQLLLKNTNNLTILEDMVLSLIVENNIVKGIKTANNTINSKIVILTTGTYLKANVLLGNNRIISGPDNELPSNELSDSLKSNGFDVIRLKTGTPPRLDKSTIDFKKLREESGDIEPYTFSFEKNIQYDVDNQIPCHITYTNSNTHNIINSNINKSSMYGAIEDLESVGPRYCPSIEDKIVRFSDKERHQLFLEPESLLYDDIYLQGFSTSMPIEIQQQMVNSLEGLENAKILKYAYAIEYDAINPINLKPSLETKIIENLFTAGQINGTSGYEEAAAQGLVAGINASNKFYNKEALVLKRNEAYIGVLIDDLVTKGVKDPYRMLTSRAEYRLLLRHDNADIRLSKHAYNNGLITKKVYDNILSKQDKIKEIIELLETTSISPNEVINNILTNKNETILNTKITLADLLKRPVITMDDIRLFIELNENDDILEQVSINIKYKGYIMKATHEAMKLEKNEDIIIPESLSYDDIPNIASEARQKLNAIKPKTLGQAIRISGVNPADISIITIYLKKEFYGKKYF